MSIQPFPSFLCSLLSYVFRLTFKATDDLEEKALLHSETNYFTEYNLQEAAIRKIDILIPDPIIYRLINGECV